MKLNLRKFLAVLVAAVVTLGASAQSLYIFGSFNGWNPGESIEMWNDNGVYTIEDIEFGAGGNFGLSTVQSSDWTTVNSNRYGFAEDNAKATEGVAMPIVKGEGAIQVPGAGVYNIYVNLAAMTVTVKKAGEVVVNTPDKLYVFGTLSVANWDPAQSVELTKEGSKFSGKVTLVDSGDGYAYFAMSSVQAGDWVIVNANRIAPTAGEVAFNLNEAVEFGKGEAAFKTSAIGEYFINVDYEKMTVTVSSESAGVESIGVENASAVYYNLQGVEVANPQDGLYIVKQGNKVSKQLIK
ncbi:MAG: SusF/SusE family outer membrane protein [Muribaculaceae bacterium]|nr:SusF/SusE family outer membrane protein [Muribaculaceae bacterium]